MSVTVEVPLGVPTVPPPPPLPPPPVAVLPPPPPQLALNNKTSAIIALGTRRRVRGERRRPPTRNKPPAHMKPSRESGLRIKLADRAVVAIVTETDDVVLPSRTTEVGDTVQVEY